MANPSAGFATNVTATVATGFPNPSVTLACSGTGSTVPGRATCPSPAMSDTDAGGPATAVTSNLTDASGAPVFGSSTRAPISWRPTVVPSAQRSWATPSLFVIADPASGDPPPDAE